MFAYTMLVYIYFLYIVIVYRSKETYLTRLEKKEREEYIQLTKKLWCLKGEREKEYQ